MLIHCSKLEHMYNSSLSWTYAHHLQLTVHEEQGMMPSEGAKRIPNTEDMSVQMRPTVITLVKIYKPAGLSKRGLYGVGHLFECSILASL